MSDVRAELQGGLVNGSELFETWEPDDHEHFGAFVQFWIGQAGKDPFDAFETWICSPSWLAERVAAREPVGRKMLGMPDDIVATNGLWILRRWSRAVVEAALEQIVDAANPGPDWGTVADRVGRDLDWEFTDLYDQHTNNRYGEPFPPAEAPNHASDAHAAWRRPTRLLREAVERYVLLSR